MEELLSFLDAVYPMTAELRSHLTQILRYKIFKTGDFLVKAGHISQHVYFIASGLLRSFYIDETGKEMNLWFMKQGDVVFAERSFYDQIPSAIAIQALKDTFAFYISEKELNAIYDRYMEFNFIGRKLTEKYYKQSLEREDIMRMHSAEKRYTYLLEHFAELANQVPDKDLATFLRMTPVWLSRLRNKRITKGTRME